MMDISKWKSIAVKKRSYLLLKGLCKEKFRAPGAMIEKILSDHIAYQAKKQKMSVEAYEKRLLNGSGK